MLRTSFERRRRQAARLALYGSMLLVAATAAGLIHLLGRPPRPRATEGWVQRDYLNMPEVKLLQRYVQIDTSATTGDEVAGARFLAERLRAAGLTPHLEQLGDRHANLWAILEGERPEALVLHNHIDVTPIADASEWFTPPFGGKIELPWIYGRGVFDMKSVAVAQLEALIALKQSGVRPKRSVIFLATGGEEYGSHLGTQWILRQHPELVRRFWAVLTEGGVVEARARGDIKYWGTEVAQKRFADLLVCGDDRDRLEEIQAILKENIEEASTGLVLTPEVRAFFGSYWRSRDSRDLRHLLADPDRLLADIGAFERLPRFVRSMFRNEAVPFALRQTADGDHELTIRFHLLPGVELAQVRDQLVPPWLTHGLTTIVRELPTARQGSPVDHPLLRAISATLKERYPGATIGPMFLPWTLTDARFFRAAGIPAYGFSPFLILTTDTLQVDAANERMALPGFAEGITIYADLLRRLASDI